MVQRGPDPRTGLRLSQLALATRTGPEGFVRVAGSAWRAPKRRWEHPFLLVVDRHGEPRSDGSVRAYEVRGPVEESGYFCATLGRDRTCDIVVRDPTVSRVHAMVEWEPAQGVYWICNRGSTNGTRVDGAKLTDRPVALTSGSLIQCGAVYLVFLLWKDRSLWLDRRRPDRRWQTRGIQA